LNFAQITSDWKLLTVSNTISPFLFLFVCKSIVYDINEKDVESKYLSSPSIPKTHFPVSLHWKYNVVPYEKRLNVFFAVVCSHKQMVNSSSVWMFPSKTIKFEDALEEN